MAHFLRFLILRLPPAYMHFGKPEAWQRNALLTDRAFIRLEIRSLGMSRSSKEGRIRQYYESLYQAWGAQHWWPAETHFEVIVGAYLTQNTSWTNVERALASLREAGYLTLEGIRSVRLSKLERLIRSSGYFRQKATRLKNFVAVLDAKYGGSLDAMFSQPTEKLRAELLDLNGVGPETADSMLLYAGNHPVFVVDAYTRRILDRHQILPLDAAYEEIQSLFQRALEPVARELETSPSQSALRLESGFRGAAHPPSAMSTAKRTALVQVYNEMHGLIVGVGKTYCRKQFPACEECPLRDLLPSPKTPNRRKRPQR